MSAPEQPSNVVHLPPRPMSEVEEELYYDALQTLDTYQAHAWMSGTFGAWSEGRIAWQLWLTDQPADEILGLAEAYQTEQDA